MHLLKNNYYVPTKYDYAASANIQEKDQLKSKEDVPVIEAFELYMLKKFHNIVLCI